MVQAALGSVVGAFAGQSHRERKERVSAESSLPVLLAAKDTRTAKRIREEAREERIFNLLTQPEVLGMLMALGGLIISNQIPFSRDEEKNVFLQAIASVMTVAMGMGYAGVGDLTSLSVGLAAGGGSLLGGLIDLRDIADIDIGNFWDSINPLAPIWRLFGIQ